MLVIRRAQMEALAAVSLSRFVDAAVLYCGAKYPQEAQKLGREALRKRVDEAVRRSTRAGLDQEEQVYAFVRWTFLKGEGFDEAPEIAEILASPLKDSSLKVIEINDALGAWEED